MPLKFTKDQIRRYLREMGYNDLSDEHLDLFIRDLKKLIRHEDKKRHARRAHFLDDPVESVSESSANTSYSPDTDAGDADGIDHSGTGRREPPTDTSTSYNSPPRNSVKRQPQKNQEQPPRPVTVPVAPKPAPTTTTRISLVPGKSPSYRPSSASTAVVPTARPDKQPDPVEELSSDSSSLETSSSSSSISSGPDTYLSRASQKSKYTGRMDPVARYHYYKNLWDKQKAPGEDRHMQLRWNVRAGTMGKVPCDPLGIRVKYLR